MNNHHDKLFRMAFSDPEQAQHLLRNLLPAAARDAADWSTLTRVDGGLVDEHLVGRHTDLLFQVELAGRPAYLYLLLEHQSSADPWMPLRMLGYVMRIWERHRKEHPKAKHLPMVCPLVLHHSRTGWHGPRCLADLLDLDEPLLEALADFIPDSTFALLDLTAHDDERLHTLVVNRLGALVLSALKHAPYDANFFENFPDWLSAWARAVLAPGGVASLAAVARYVLEVSDTATVDKFTKVLESAISKENVEKIMTIAEQLRHEGRAEGIAKGRAEGITEVVLKQLTLRFGPLSDDLQARVRGASVDQLDTMAERLLTAATLEEVVTEL